MAYIVETGDIYCCTQILLFDFWEKYSIYSLFMSKYIQNFENQTFKPVLTQNK